MMGRRRRDQGKLFYEFRLEDRIPENHLLRRMNVFVTAALAGLHKDLAPYYSDIGRPSIDPELMIRMLIVGYCYGLRSERRLVQEVDLHLGFRWFCKLDLDDEIPHHSTFSSNRLGRFRESDLLRHVFERVVWSAMALGLIKGEGFAVDASVLEANASRYHGKAPEELDWTEQQRQTRAVREYLAALDQAAEPNPDRKIPKVISPSDPSSAWTAKANKRVQFGYGLNYLIDIENAAIVDVEATPARTYDEVAATKTMIDRTEACFALKPTRLAADTAYGTGKFLGWLVKEKRITPHIPVWEKGNREDGIFSRADFVWDKKRGQYICPNGKILHTSGTVHDGRTLLYRASKRDCDACPLRAKCCTREEARKVPRDLHEDARDVALWRDNLDEKRRPWRIMVAPNPDRCKPLVTVPRAAMSSVMPFFCLSPGPTASAYALGVTSACWGAAAGIVQRRETSVSANRVHRDECWNGKFFFRFIPMKRKTFDLSMNAHSEVTASFSDGAASSSRSKPGLPSRRYNRRSTLSAGVDERLRACGRLSTSASGFLVTRANLRSASSHSERCREI